MSYSVWFPISSARIDIHLLLLGRFPSHGHSPSHSLSICIVLFTPPYMVFSSIDVVLFNIVVSSSPFAYFPYVRCILLEPRSDLSIFNIISTHSCDHQNRIFRWSPLSLHRFMTSLRNFTNAAPCRGFVNTSAHMSPVGQYSTVSCLARIRSVTKK